MSTDTTKGSQMTTEEQNPSQYIGETGHLTLIAAWFDDYAKLIKETDGDCEVVRDAKLNASRVRGAISVIEQNRSLPRTADGVAIGLGMRVFPSMLADYEDVLDQGGTVTEIRLEGEITIRDSQGEKGPHFLEAYAGEVYSTRAAALSARPI